MNAGTRLTIYRIIPFGIIWFVFGLIYILLERGLIGEMNYYPSTGNPYDFKGNSWFSLLITTSSGLLVGTFEVKVLSTLFNNISFGRKILYKTGIYVLIAIVFLLTSSVLVTSVELNKNVFDPQVLGHITAFISSYAFWSVELYIAVIIIVSLFYLEVSESMGLKLLHNFFLGKYHVPIEEERIFMFLDMNSSTTIAEKLGHIKYFELLKAYYSDLSKPILKSTGEVYQYVGDEIVVSWELRGEGSNNDCLDCFFSMKEELQSKSAKYQEDFGVSPSFKAGIHFGKVTAGEIGIIKKDIIFTGDVLNTTARIQGLCKKLGVDILISNGLKNLLMPNLHYEFKSLGQNELQGKRELMELYVPVKRDKGI